MKPGFAKKRYGQHFLHDPGTIDRIVRAIDPQPGDRIVEVGPGRGAITVPVLQRAGALDVVEIDRDVIPTLEAACAGRGSLRVHLADALEFDFRALRGVGDRPVAGILAVQDAQRVLGEAVDAFLGQVAAMRFKMRSNRRLGITV